LKDIHDILREFKKRRDEVFALATLVRVKGSSYRRAGARMLICQDGNTVGSLSGGCIEEEVAFRAHDVLMTSQPEIISFDTRRRFGCHGQIEIFIERCSETFLSELTGALGTRRSCLVSTNFEGKKLGSRVVKIENDYEQEHEETFGQKIHPPLRLLIFGEGLDSAPLFTFSELLGWEAIEVIDAGSFPLEPDKWTAAIVKSHNYGRDFAALQKLLPLNLRYVGLIGPRQRRDQLLNELLDIGVSINAGFFAPAGLDLGAETPEEIALAIISEIQRVFGRGCGESLRERKVAIHAPKPSQACALLAP
jgi:xanthine dehydrogenase accessory factor